MMGWAWPMVSLHGCLRNDLGYVHAVLCWPLPIFPFWGFSHLCWIHCCAERVVPTGCTDGISTSGSDR